MLAVIGVIVITVAALWLLWCIVCIAWLILVEAIDTSLANIVWLVIPLCLVAYGWWYLVGSHLSISLK